MDGTLIATTSNADLQALGTGGQSAIHVWDQIAGYIRRSLGPDHAALFAEPNQDPDRGVTDWYAEGQGQAVILDALEETERQSALAELARLHGDVQAESDRLRQSRREDERFLGEMLGLALVTPGPEYVRVVGGKPVLVAWGHRAVGDAAQPELLIGELSNVRAPRPAPGAAARSAAATATVEPMTIVGAPQSVRKHPWTLWAASALATLLVLFLTAFLLLRMQPGWLGTPTAQCVVAPADLALQEEIRGEERREVQMRAEIARIALALGDRRTRCPPVSPAPAVPDLRQQRADADRAAREGARTGKIQVILAWDNTSDLDLAVFCPNGSVIFFNVPSACGGTLDVDRNATNPTPNAVENIVFAQEPAPGRYRIVVINYQQGASGPPATSFRVTLRQEGQPDRAYSGTVAPKQRTEVASFDVPASR